MAPSDADKAVIEVRRALGRDDVLAYAHLTDDFNPIHVDEAFAASSPFGQTIVHGTLTLTLVWELLPALRPQQGANGSRVSVRFTAPVAVGETVTATLEPVAGADGSIRIVVRREDGATALTADVGAP